DQVPAASVQEDVAHEDVLSADDSHAAGRSHRRRAQDATVRDPDVADAVAARHLRAVDVDPDRPRIGARSLLDLDIVDTHPRGAGVRRGPDDPDGGAGAGHRGSVSPLLTEHEVPDAISRARIARIAAGQLEEGADEVVIDHAG